MCQKCQDAIDEYFPDASKQDVHDILWNKTSFPFGKPDQIRRQLKEYKDDPEKVDREINEMFNPIHEEAE